MLKRNIGVNPKKKKKGQSTVEYIILVAAVLAVLILFLQPNGPFYRAFNETLTTGTNGMTNMATRLYLSR
ncbi:MAG: class III signal peptide-containing protein [Candidatus Omnitrophica bacterium]|nr:class III signal peptide-containing protein [Candidatus Omnitrophota bacterium]